MIIIIYIAYVCISVSLLIIISSIGKYYFGLTGEIIASIIGFMLIVFFVLSSHGLGSLFCLINRIIPFLPRCECGKCRYCDFNIQIFGSRNNGGEWSIWTCKCGCVYKMSGCNFFKLVL